MSISYSENSTLTCPSCRNSFTSEVWMLVDAAERPDLAEALRDGTLDVVVCPRCGHRSPAGAPLLFHDAANRRVYFAAAPGSQEHELREQAQSLLYMLVGSLPEQERHAYLGDVQVEQEVEGVRRAVLRRQKTRRAHSPDPAQEPGQPAHGAEHHVVEAPPAARAEEPSPILGAVQALIAADSSEEFDAIVEEHPMLLGEDADAAILHLAEIARDQGEHEVAAALREARARLAMLRSEAGEPRPVALGADAGTGSAIPGAGSLSDAAYQALLAVASPDELREAVRDHPALLEVWADADLAARVDGALDAGDERLARDVEERREVLAALRAELSGQASLPKAIRALLQARGEDDLTAALTEHPILLTGAAQDALFELAAEARTRGDEQLAEYATECSAMLRKVREGLEAG
jgi:hypothetical protein